MKYLTMERAYVIESLYSKGLDDEEIIDYLNWKWHMSYRDLRSLLERHNRCHG